MRRDVIDVPIGESTAKAPALADRFYPTARRQRMNHEPEILVNDLYLRLEPATGRVPFATVVHSIRLRLTNDVLAKMLEAALVMGRERAPVELELRSARFTIDGAEAIVQVSKGRFLKTDVRALIGFSTADAEHVRVEVKEVKGLGKIPIDAFVEPALEKALAMASSRPGIERASEAGRILLIRPDELLASLGVPLKFGTPGDWHAQTSEGELEARFRTRT